MQRFPSEQLRTLAAVIDEGSFEAAAYQLGITSPAVSQRIKALEITSGRVLVQRTRPVTTTSAGAVLLRLARQVALAEAEATLALGEDAARPEIRIAVNADSLATWALPALIAATRAVPMALEILREDESNSAELLRNGSAMAAITSLATPVQGCSVVHLGDVVYQAVASPEFCARWFGGGVNAAAIRSAPVARFDRRDTLLDAVPQLQRMGAVLGSASRRAAPAGALSNDVTAEESRDNGVSPQPTVFIPGSREFVEAIAAGMAWGFVDDAQAHRLIASGDLLPLKGIDQVPVPLYWQQWRLPSVALSALADAVGAAASQALAATSRRHIPPSGAGGRRAK